MCSLLVPRGVHLDHRGGIKSLLQAQSSLCRNGWWLATPGRDDCVLAAVTSITGWSSCCWSGCSTIQTVQQLTGECELSTWFTFTWGCSTVWTVEYFVPVTYTLRSYYWCCCYSDYYWWLYDYDCWLESLFIGYFIGWDRYWRRVIGISRFCIGIGNNALIPAPIPQTRHVCVTKTIVLCFDDAHQSHCHLTAPAILCDFDVHRRLYTNRHGKRWGVEYRPPAVQSICVCIYLIYARDNDHCWAITLSSLPSPSLSSRWPTDCCFFHTAGVRLHMGLLYSRPISENPTML